MLFFFKKKSSVKNVTIVAGGTCGHIIPALVVAETFLKKECNVFFVTDRKFDLYSKYFGKICNDKNFIIKYINMSSHRNNVLQMLLRACFAVIECFKIVVFIIKNRIGVVVGFGSYVSLPSIIAGWICCAKTFVHEQNSHMGLANRVSSFFCKSVMLSFPETDGIPFLVKYKAIVTGFPLRKEVRDLHYHNTIETINYESFFRIYNIIRIVVVGGSQGARFFQETVPFGISLLSDLAKEKVIIYHQTGKDNIDEIKNLYNKIGVKSEVKDFFSNMPELMSSSHIVISRSGAGSAFEIMALGTPVLFIPYPFATNNHQLKNALFMQKNGAAILIEQKDVTPQKIFDILDNIFFDTKILASLSHHAKLLSDINAHIKIVEIIESFVGKIGKELVQESYDKKKIVKTNVSMS